MKEIKKVLNVAYHRNRISGTGFHVITFVPIRATGAKRMVGVVFPDKGNVAVFDLDLLGQGNIEFGQYEPELRKISVTIDSL